MGDAGRSAVRGRIGRLATSRIVLLGGGGLAAVALIVTTTASIVGTNGQASRLLHAEVRLARATTSVDLYRYGAQDLAQGMPPTPSVIAGIDAERAQAALLVREVADVAPLATPIVGLERQLDHAVGDELRLVAAGQTSSAGHFDDATVSPLADHLVRMLDRDDAHLAAASSAAARSALRGIVVAMLLRGGLALGVLLVLEGARRRRLGQRREAEAERRSAERVAALVRHATDLLTVVSPEGVVRFEAPSTAELLGYEPGALVGTAINELAHPEDRVLLQLLCEEGAEDHVDLRLRDASGDYRSFEVRATRLLDHPEIEGIVLNARDVTAHKLLEHELHHQAFHDALTGLANRALFHDRLEHALARRHRGTLPIAVLFVDLDDFKAVNDSLGHRSGDRLLVEIARRLRLEARAGDTIARLGGDSFGLLLEEPGDADQAVRVARRILAALREPIERDDAALVVKASIGIAFPTADGTTAEALVRNAEVAMYSAKRCGKDRIARYREGMHAAVLQRFDLLHDLQAALAAGDQLEVHYQPIVRLSTGEVTSVEALVRWRHPTRGLVPPAAFIPLAEESGLVVPLGRAVLAEATSQLARWQARYPGLEEVTVAVNASARQLRDPGFAEDVRATLAASGLAARNLVLEITESVFLGDEEVVAARLGALKALGAGLAIDDFGTGYSSLGYLKRYPIDVLKVDLSFVADLTGGGRRGALAEAIVKMGAALQIETIAEGVELHRQAEALQALECDLAQGFLFAKPLPASECEALLATGSPPLVRAS